ncbi:MAG: hypothetical protein J7K87_00215 [Candidatus Aenigmarchaeota archaeon]|nr:hypothetical protein [Candidatus Aenigmarchaeota archaeon]
MTANILSYDFFVYLFPWMLTLAIVYGILEHYKIPQSQSARGVISLVAAFMVLPFAPALASFISGMVKGLIVVGVGILVALIFVEMLGYKVGKKENIFEKYPVGFGVVLILIAIIVFVSAGGLSLLNVNLNLNSDFVTALFVIAIMALGVWWMTAKSGE